MSKTVHIELLEDIATECFFASSKRFISRRDLPRHMYFDNGSTYKNACKRLPVIGQFFEQNTSKINLFVNKLKKNVEEYFWRR